MLAPLLNTAPVHTQPGLLNESPKALQKVVMNRILSTYLISSMLNLSMSALRPV